ncbi:unnamed protein product [Rotaria sp. Silwood2]|nr:unnamed protein product [Rotaria sp. Silwood2]CAF3236981.1 unnamed protein product [Rotaria sp. Silwood2]CAF3982435.1 unnamed protein product [Rotaria sp. Silwood2]CAF4082597.1 unnamed protein product [Rotaria sp. Silwood2]
MRPNEQKKKIADEDLIELLQLNQSKLTDVARFCNRYPNIEVSYEIRDKDDLTSDSIFNVYVALERADKVS